MNPTAPQGGLDKKSLLPVFNIIDDFREIDSEMPVQQMLIFVWVARNEGKTQRELRDAFPDLPSSTASRNLAALSKVHRLGKPGLGMIDWVESPEDRRQKLIYLTPKGKTFAAKLASRVG